MNIRSLRAQELRVVADEMALQHRSSFLGSIRSVLWEGARGKSGLTDNYLRVSFEASEVLRNIDGEGEDLIENVKLIRLEGL